MNKKGRKSVASSWAHQSDLRRRLSIFPEFRIVELPDSIISASGVVSSHSLLLHDDFRAPLIIHHEVRDLTIHQEDLDLGPFWFLHWCPEPGEAAAAIFAFLLRSLMFLSTLLGVLRSLPELYDVGHFVVVHFHSVQVSCWSDWILRGAFSA